MFLLDGLVDVLVSLLGPLSPLAPLALFALVVAALAVVALRVGSNPSRVRATKDRLEAHLLELWLFRDEPRIVLSAQARMLRLNARYLGLMLVPLLLALGPVAAVLASLDGVFGVRPLRPGEATLVSVVACDGVDTARVRLTGGEAVRVETPPLRIPSEGRVDWRIRALRPGLHTVQVDLGDRRFTKQVVIGDALVRVPATRLVSGGWQRVIAGYEPAIPPGHDIERIDVRYPGRSVVLLGWSTHWLVPLLAASFLGTLVLARVAGAEL